MRYTRSLGGSFDKKQFCEEVIGTQSSVAVMNENIKLLSKEGVFRSCVWANI